MNLRPFRALVTSGESHRSTLPRTSCDRDEPNIPFPGSRSPLGTEINGFRRMKPNEITTQILLTLAALGCCPWLRPFQRIATFPGL